MTQVDFSHQPVMPDQCLRALAVKPGGVYVDATLGAGGHAVRILEALRVGGDGGRLVGIDKDPLALARSASILGVRADVLLLHGDFGEMDKLLSNAGIHSIDGALFDLGVSSPQLDDPARGFSYRHDAPLDMRMNPGDPVSAFDIVNHWPASELKRILYTYGEEIHAPLIVASIEKKRYDTPILTTGQLAELIVSAMPPAARRGKGHPAKRSFQAIRMAVNDELVAIEKGLTAAIRLLSRGGRLVVLSFHSVEDRIVKTVLRDAARGCDCPPYLPICICGKTPLVKPLYRKPLTPDSAEKEDNRRSHSAKLRACEKM